MGCKLAKDKDRCHNRFDRSFYRSSSRSGTPRAGSRSVTPQVTPRESRRREKEIVPVELLPRQPIDQVSLVLARFDKLPPDTVRRVVYSVYDGDTITLRGDDNAKVRLLAMDTPEVQDHEPFALEARDFLAKFIADKKVYLAFEGQEKDRYGRYLAYIFVKDKSVEPFSYLCANIALVEAGLANYYHPQQSPLSFDAIFLAAQRGARASKLNIWRGVNEEAEVFLTPHGKAFHCNDCPSVAGVPLTSIVMKDALDNGHYACRDCHPNWRHKEKRDAEREVTEQGHGEVVVRMVERPSSTDVAPDGKRETQRNES